VWAWGKGRVKKMKGVVDKTLVIFPFEVNLYREAGIDVEFVSHPLLESLQIDNFSREDFCKTWGFDRKKKLLALFPGSRVQEIENLFPIMVEAGLELKKRLNVEIGVGAAPNIDEKLYEQYIPGNSMQLIRSATYSLMRCADAAIVKSGTGTLETACFGTPMLVVYKTSWLNYFIGSSLVSVKDIGLVNIVAGKRIVPELLQKEVTPANIIYETTKLLGDEKLRLLIKEELAQVREKLGTVGASVRVADVIMAGGW
jgi:lipid-A-disaccharide synthase